MVERFTIEVWGRDEDDVTQEMALTASQFVALVKMNGSRGEWECISEKIDRKKGNFIGRVEFRRLHRRSEDAST
jgi:hypothetical protein